MFIKFPSVHYTSPAVLPSVQVVNRLSRVVQIVRFVRVVRRAVRVIHVIQSCLPGCFPAGWNYISKAGCICDLTKGHPS